MNNNTEKPMNELVQAVTDLAYGDDGLLTDYYEQFVFKTTNSK